MNRNIKVIITGSIMSVLGFATIYASSNQNPGSVQDPLVTKSYVDSRISEIANADTNQSSDGSSLNIDELIEQIEQVVEFKLSEREVAAKEDTSKESDKNIDELIEQIEEIVDYKLEEKDVKERIETIKDSDSDKDLDEDIDGFVFNPIGPIESGSTIIGEQGTELILRSGSAFVIAEGINGLQDMTEGVDLEANSTVPLNHLLIVPRTDGRGILIEKSAFIMIRGNYEIQEN